MELEQQRLPPPLINGESFTSACNRLIRESSQPNYVGLATLAPPAFTAHSEYNSSYSAVKCRMNGPAEDCWCPAKNRAGEWLHVDLGSPCLVAGVRISGGKDRNYYCTSVLIEHSLTGRHWTSIGTRAGNYDSHSLCSVNFPPGIIARFVRFTPETWHNHIGLRVDITFAREVQYRAALSKSPDDLDGARNYLAAPVCHAMRTTKRPKHNTLIFGDQGAGKTSFLASSITALSGSPHIVHAGVVRSNGQSITRENTRFDMSYYYESGTLPHDFPFIFQDFAGRDPGIMEHYMTYALDGLVPDNTNLHARQPLQISDEDRIASYYRRPQCVIICVTLAEATLPELWIQYHNLIEQCAHRHISVIILVTKIDAALVDQELADMPDKAWSHLGIYEKLKKISELSRISIGHILLMKNYVGEQQATESVNVMALTALISIRQRCEETVERWIFAQKYSTPPEQSCSSISS